MDNQDNYLVDLGNEIRRRREQISLSQETFAAVVGLHRTYVGAIERGERNLTIASLLRISRSLNLTPGALLSAAERTAGMR